MQMKVYHINYKYLERCFQFFFERKTMREIDCGQIRDTVREMCIEAAHFLPADMKDLIRAGKDNEQSPVGKQVLQQLCDNLDIAEKEMIPICQDTGMAVFFIEIGQEVHIAGGLLEDAVNEGVRRGYKDGYLRKSIVEDPINRVNTGDNTPAVIHEKLTAGDQLKITLAPKGFGSENMSRIVMLKPADGIEGVKREIVRLTRPAGVHSDIPWVKELEEELLERINCLGIGPAGLGGTVTALAVNIETFPTHIAGLPLAVNICCHADRHVTRVL